jgi:hypothetical protein
MRPQFLANINGEYFLEADAKKLGPFFEKKKLGRAVALLDWNRDGLEDACMTHVHEPVALLSNTTAAAGHFVAIQLRGVNSSRDAIGTTVEVKSGDQTWKRQLVAGDGFSASNERQLIFGLGDRTQIDSITVHWTRSKAQTYEDVEGDHRYIAVEGQAQLRELPVAQPRSAQIENSDL